MNAPRHIERRGGDGDRPLANFGGAANPLRRRVGGCQQALEIAADHARRLGDAMGRLDLAEHVGFADHQAVQRRRDSEQMARRLGALQGKQPGGQLAGVDPSMVAKNSGHRGGGGGGVMVNGMDLDPVAGRQQQGLADAGVSEPRIQRADVFFLDHQAFAQGKRRRSVIGADDDKCRPMLHGGANGAGRAGGSAPGAGRSPARP